MWRVRCKEAHSVRCWGSTIFEQCLAFRRRARASPVTVINTFRCHAPDQLAFCGRLHVGRLLNRGGL